MLEIIQSEFIKSATKPSQYPASAYAEIAFAGKSNVGKSSLINTLTKRKQIAKTSTKPGKTRLINFFKIRFREDGSQQEGYLHFVDLPGYGYAKVSKQERKTWKQMLETFFSERIQLRGVVILVDIRHKADPKDEMMIEMLQQIQIPFLVVATKADKIGKTKLNLQLQKLQNGFSLHSDQIIAVSSTKKKGIEQVNRWLTDVIL